MKFLTQRGRESGYTYTELSAEYTDEQLILRGLLEPETAAEKLVLQIASREAEVAEYDAVIESLELQLATVAAGKPDPSTTHYGAVYENAKTELVAAQRAAAANKKSTNHAELMQLEDVTNENMRIHVVQKNLKDNKVQRAIAATALESLRSIQSKK